MKSALSMKVLENKIYTLVPFAFYRKIKSGSAQGSLRPS